jgi:hypothetical protein
VKQSIQGKCFQYVLYNRDNSLFIIQPTKAQIIVNIISLRIIGSKYLLYLVLFVFSLVEL